MKKLKKLLILAIVPTTILFNASFAFANTTDKLQLMFDQLKTNPEFQDGQLYINAKFITKSGLILQWNSETSSFVVGSGDENTTPPTTPIVNPVPAQPIINSSDNVTQTTYKGLKSIIVNGITYFDRSDYETKFYDRKTSNKACYGYDKFNNILIYQLNGINEEIIINQDDVKIYLGRVWIHSKYYREP